MTESIILNRTIREKFLEHVYQKQHKVSMFKLRDNMKVLQLAWVAKKPIEMFSSDEISHDVLFRIAAFLNSKI